MCRSHAAPAHRERLPSPSPQDEEVAVPAWLGLPPPGLEVWAEFEAGVDEGAAFQELTQALGGLLCTTLASLPAAGIVAAPAVGWFGELPVQRCGPLPASG